MISQLTDPMILLLLGAAVVTILLGDMVDTVVILAVVILNTGLGVSQELRAERALEALTSMASPKCRVFRDGRSCVLEARELVPDDIVQIDAGDIVPADVQLQEAWDLQVDEAMLTGESIPVHRAAEQVAQAGTVVTRGRGIGEVVRTGSASALGQIAATLEAQPPRPTPLQTRLSRLSRTLVILALGACVLIFALGILRGEDPAQMMVLAVSLAVAAVPESLPAVVAVALALGAYRMAGRSAVVRKLPAVETLGSVDVIASDKTGTLTEGLMVVRALWTPSGTVTVTGSGYSPDGRLEGAISDGEVEALLTAGVLCNDADLLFQDDAWRPVGDPLEVAILVAAMKAGLDPHAVRRRWPRTAEEPFDADRGAMRTWHSERDGASTTEIFKGVPERLSALAEPSAREAIERAAVSMAERGLRVIAVGQIVAGGLDDHRQSAPQLLGLLGIQDPPRADAAGIVDACRRAGVRVVMVTGDHPATSRAIAREVGITDDSGGEAAGDDVLHRPETVDLAAVDIFFRVRPEEKVAVVRALQSAGNVVAVTGDGVNDAPALRAADIGVAMGLGGTEVARQSADLVLADDNLGTVVNAIAEGRRILANIRRFLGYALSGGLAEILVLLVAPFVGMGIPLLPAQILWINMLTHGLPGVAFGAEPLDPRLMHRPSSPPEESVLRHGLAQLVLWAGTLIGIVSLLAGVVADHVGQPSSTSIFIVLGVAQLALALALRAPRERSDGWRSRGLELAVAAALAAQLAAVYLPPLQSLLQTESIPGTWLAVLLLLAVVPGVIVRLASWLQRRRRSATRSADLDHG